MSATKFKVDAYLRNLSSAKQCATRQSRIDKCRPKIMVGKGINDR